MHALSYLMALLEHSHARQHRCATVTGPMAKTGQGGRDCGDAANAAAGAALAARRQKWGRSQGTVPPGAGPSSASTFLGVMT